MKTSFRLSVNLCLMILLMGACGAPVRAAELPVAEIAAYVKEQDVPAWKAVPGARLQRDYEARWLKWFERTVMGPFAARVIADDATRERALRLVRQGMLRQRNSVLADPAFTAAKMLAECEELGKSGVNDPLVLWLHSWALHAQTLDSPGSDALFKRCVQQPQYQKMPATTRLLIMAGFQQQKFKLNELHHRSTPRSKDMVEAAWESLHEKAYLPDEDDILDENILPAFRKPVMTGNESRVQEICGLPMLSEWARHMLTGHYHDRAAWNARGNSYAANVKPEGWVGFEQHYELAVKAFQQAWELRKDTPEAAYELLGISLTGGDTGEQPFVWLQRVLDAQFDHHPSFQSLMNGLLPRWGGSHKMMLACGLSCAATKRFDTRVPYFFFEALTAVAKEADDWREICQQPVIARTAIALCQQRVKEAPTQELKQEALMLLGTYGWICGDYEVAHEVFSQVPAKFPRSVVVQLLHLPEHDEKVMRGESAIYAIGHGDAWEAAEAALEQKKLAAAEDGYQSILAQLNGVAGGAELAESRLATVRFERSLAAGEWVPLRVDPTLAGWQIQKGNWTGTQDGHLINRGAGTSAFIFNQGRIEADFQIRGKFEPAGSGMGVLIAFGRDDRVEEHWLTCMMRRTSAIILDHYSLCNLTNQKVPQLTTPSTFQITCHQGRVTFEVNGQEVFTEVVPVTYYEPHNPLPLLGHVGFCHPLIKRDDVTTILPCEIRLLPPDFKREP